MKFLQRRRARREVIIAAKLVASGYEPDLQFQHDPDDLSHLHKTVTHLRRLEKGDIS